MNSKLNDLKPILFLLVSSPLIAEVFVSHNTSLGALLSPSVWFWMILTYGVPVVFIREISKRMNLNIVSIALLGISYVILNEGIIAQTLSQIAGEPAGVFIGYGTLAGIHSVWALFILTWHALFSVLLPILLVHSVYPSQAHRPWLGKKTFFMLGALTALQYALYLNGGLVPTINSPRIFFFYLAFTLVLIILAIRIGRLEPVSLVQSKPAHVWGMVFFGVLIPNIFYFLAYAATLSGFPAAIIFFFGLGLFVFFLKFIYQIGHLPNNLLIFLISSSIGFSVMSAIFSGNSIFLLNSTIYLTLSGFILKRAIKQREV